MACAAWGDSMGSVPVTVETEPGHPLFVSLAQPDLRAPKGLGRVRGYSSSKEKDKDQIKQRDNPNLCKSGHS